MSQPRPIVLVHGASHGAWCYSRVVPLLEAAGHEVIAPTLSGLGERADLLPTGPGLSVHVEDVSKAIREAELTDVVLVGHSYGSFVIDAVAAAMPERIAALVYLDGAFLPDGVSALDAMIPDPAAQAAFLESTQDAGGVRVLPAMPAAAYGVNEADQAWVDSLLTPTPVATITDRQHLAGPIPDVPRTYVRSTWEGPGLTAIVDGLRGQAGWTIVDLPCGHDMMIDLPRETADALLAAAR